MNEKKKFNFKISKKSNANFDSKQVNPNKQSPSSLNISFKKASSSSIPTRKVPPTQRVVPGQPVQGRAQVPVQKFAPGQSPMQSRTPGQPPMQNRAPGQPMQRFASGQTSHKTSNQMRATQNVKKTGNMDFEAFRSQKKNEQQRQTRLAMSKGKKATRERYKRVEGMTGGGSKYQDHRLAEGIPDILPLHAGEGEKYQDHKIGNALDTELHRTAGKGAKYQDHRVANALTGPKPKAQGERYQDHRHGGIDGKKNKKSKNFSFRKP